MLVISLGLSDSRSCALVMDEESPTSSMFSLVQCVFHAKPSWPWRWSVTGSEWSLCTGSAISKACVHCYQRSIRPLSILQRLTYFHSPCCYYLGAVSLPLLSSLKSTDQHPNWSSTLPAPRSESACLAQLCFSCSAPFIWGRLVLHALGIVHWYSLTFRN